MKTQENSSGLERQISIRVATYNIARGKWATSEQIADALKALRLDIVFLNEVPKPKPGQSVPDWSWRVARELGMAHTYTGTIGPTRSNPKKTDVSGKYYAGHYEAILSRTPLINIREMKLRSARKESSIIIRAETRIGEEEIALYVLHLPPDKEWDTSNHRDLAERILSDEPLSDTIVGGDFNRPHGCPVMQELLCTAGLTNALLKDCGRSVDHILYRSCSDVCVMENGLSWGPTTGQGKNGHLSDHPYVWTELLLQTP